jgi:hypothetical protein
MAISSRGAIGSLIAVVVLLSAVAPVVFAESATAASCSGTQITAGASIQAAIDGHASGTTFCLAAGIYNVSTVIVPKSNDSFIGTGLTRDDTLVKTTTLQNIFSTGTSKGSLYRHFAITGAINACPGQNCGETGTAILRPTDVTVDDMHLYGNGRTAISGGGGLLTVTGSEVDHNGAMVDGVSGGIKRIDPLTVTNSFVHDNKGNGIWCDMQCGSFTVTGNTVTGNTGSGIFDEISDGPATFSNNTVKNNNTDTTTSSYYSAGILLMDSIHANVYGNILGGNGAGRGIAVVTDSRGGNCGTPDSNCGYVPSDISIHDNTPNGDVLTGCATTGVTCSKNP